MKASEHEIQNLLLVENVEIIPLQFTLPSAQGPKEPRKLEWMEKPT